MGRWPIGRWAWLRWKNVSTFTTLETVKLAVGPTLSDNGVIRLGLGLTYVTGFYTPWPLLLAVVRGSYYMSPLNTHH